MQDSHVTQAGEGLFGNRKVTRGSFLKMGGAVAAGAAITPLLSACGKKPPGASSEGDKTLKIAAINNPDIEVMAKLAPEFTKDTGIKVDFNTLPDQELRQKVTQDVARGAGSYDIVTISPYEVQSNWVENGWVEPLDAHFDDMKNDARSEYDLEDVIGPVKNSLSVNEKLYALPFYGESNFTYYRKDLFEQAGLEMPENPTWSQIEGFAKKLHKPDQGQYGIILKGVPDYGQLAPFITFTHSYGARWFNEDWQPQFTSPEFKKAAESYINLVQNYGEPGASSVGFNEGLGLMSQGKGALWVDATVAAGALNDPESSKVVDEIGYAMAPTEGCDNGSHWLYTWALAVEANSDNKDAAFKFLTWATSKDYINLVAERYSWSQVPPGTRNSTYENEEYQKVAPWAKQTLKSINTATPNKPACPPVPYTGTAQINIPEYADWAFNFGQGFSAAVAGEKSVDQWLQESDTYTTKVMKESGYIGEGQ